MSSWFVATEGEPKGPFTPSQLRQLAATGRIGRETLICPAGTENWVKAGQAKGLFPALEPADVATSAPALASNSVLSSVADAATSVSPVPLAVQPVEPTVPGDDLSPVENNGIHLQNRSEQIGSSRSSLRWLYWSSAVMAIVAASVVMTIMAVRSNETPKPDDASGPPVVARKPEAAAESSETRKDIERLEKEYDELKKSVKQLRDENDRLSDEKKELEKNIQQLTVSWNELRQWRSVDVVMINPSHVAVGLRTEAAGALIVDRIANGAVTPQAIAVALNAGIPFISADPQLTREVASRFAVGHTISGDHEQRVRRYWKNHRLIETQQSDAVEWVAFSNQASRSHQIGIFLNADAEQMTYITPNGEERSVRRQDILAGSAAKGDMDTIIRSLDEHLFLDQCMMRVAQKIQASSSGVSTHALGIEVSVEQPDRQLSSQLLDLEWPEIPDDFPRWFRGGYFFANFLHILHQNDQVADERRRLKILEDATNYLEDELHKKLSSMGVIALDRSALGYLTEARECARYGSSLGDYAHNATLSHALIVTVKAPVRGGRYHLGVRLLDARSGAVLFAENADRIDESVQDVVCRSGGHREYHFDSGRLAVITTKDLPPSDFHPVESPPLVQQTRTGNTSSRSQLVYVESDESDYSLQYRSLFTKRRYTAKQSDFASIKYVSTADDVPRPDLFRYLVCRAVSRTLPSGGRIKKVDGNRVVVSIGRDGGVVEGDTLRVTRYFDNDYRQVIDELQGQESEELLPIRLTVATVHEHYCDAIVSNSGFENIWPEDYQLREGDIVIPAHRQRVSVGVLPFIWMDPDRDTSLAQSVRQGRKLPGVVLQRAGNFSINLCDELSESFAGLGLSTTVLANGLNPRGEQNESLHARQLRSIQEQGATHAVGGFVQPVTDTSYRVRMAIVSLNKPEARLELTDTMDFKMSDGNIPD